MAANDRFQHIMFYGPSGTGKTTIAKILTFVGSGGNKNNVLELNASHERGIDTIRDLVKTFTNLAVKNNKKWRYVIMDECDSLTKQAQSALRRIMEEHMHTTRFFLLCNFKYKMILPIRSRCHSFRFKVIPFKFMLERIKFICAKEQVDISITAIESIIRFSSGDMRKAIQLLETCSCLETKTSNIRSITEEHVDYMTNGRERFRKMFDDLLVKTNRTFNDVNLFAKTVIAEAMDMFQVLHALQDFVLCYEPLPCPLHLAKSLSPSTFTFHGADNQKADILMKIGEVDSNLTEKADEYLQLMDLLSLFFQ